MAEVIPIRVKITPEDVEKTSRKVKTEIRGIERQAERTGKKIDKEVGRGFEGLLKNVKSATVAITKFGLAAAAAATGVALVVNEVIDFADSIAKTSAVVGVTAEELQRLRFAAEQSGVATGQLDLGLQRFSRRVAEAAQGGGELSKVIEQYNIQLRDSNGQLRSNADILRDYADVIKNAESEQEQLRLAFKAFDSEGARLVTLLRGGSEAIDEYARQADELGLVISDDLTRGAEEAADQINILGTALKATFSTIILENIDNIKGASTALAEYVGWAGQLYQWLLKIDKPFQDFIDRLTQGRLLGEQQPAVIRRPIPPGQEETPLLPGAGDLPGTRTPTRPSRDPFAMGRLSPAEILESEFREIDAANDELYKKEEERLDRVGELSRDTWQTQAEDRYAAQSRAYDILIQQDEEYARQASTVLNTATASWRQGLENFISTGKISFKGLIDGMISDLARLGVNRIFQVLVGGAGAGGGGGLTGILTGLFGNAKGNVIKRYTKGGLIDKPTIFPARRGMALAGEAGDEAIMPLKRDRKGNLGVSGGAGTVNNFYINAIDTQSFAEAARRSGAIPSLVAEDIGNNGVARNAVLNAR